MGITVKVKNSQLVKFNKLIENIIRATDIGGVRIGIFEGATNTDTGERVADYAAINEFGGANHPPRPFMRMTLMKNGDKWKNIFLKAIEGRLVENPDNIRIGFRRVGIVGRDDMRDMIMSNVPPPNSPKTVARKKKRATAENADGTTSTGYFGTLLDSGNMHDSVDMELYGRNGETLS